jgi:hypothetical protein
MKNIPQIDAKIAVLKARIHSLEVQKEQILAEQKLNQEGFFIASDFARELGVSRAYISANKHLFNVKTHEGREYFAKN